MSGNDVCPAAINVCPSGNDDPCIIDVKPSDEQYNFQVCSTKSNFPIVNICLCIKFFKDCQVS